MFIDSEWKYHSAEKVADNRDETLISWTWHPIVNELLLSNSSNILRATQIKQWKVNKK